MHTQLHDIVADMARARAEAPALTHDDTTVSYAELWQGAQAFGSGLAGVGLARAASASRSSSTSGSRPWPRSSARRAAGGVFVPVNPVLRPQQVAYILDDCDVRVLVTHAPSGLALLREELAECPALEHVIVVEAARTGGRRRAATRCTPGRLRGRRQPTRSRSPGRSTSTWRRSSTPRAAPASPRAWCSATAT